MENCCRFVLTITLTVFEVIFAELFSENRARERKRKTNRPCHGCRSHLDESMGNRVRNYSVCMSLTSNNFRDTAVLKKL